MQQAGVVELVELLGDHGNPGRAVEELAVMRGVDQVDRHEPVLLSQRQSL